MIFIYNRDEVQIDTLNIKPRFIREIGKLNTLEFECEKDYEKGFRVVFEYKGKPYEFIIIDQQYERGDKVSFRYFCQDSFVENSGVPILDKRPTGSYKVALEVALADSRWELVTGSDYSESVQYFNSFYHISALEAFADVVNKYGLEFETSFTFTGSKITSRKIHIKKLGEKANSRLEFGKNIVKFERKILPENIVTALYGYGKGEETETGGYGRRTSFADINGGLAYVTNEEARLKYGIGPIGAKKHIFGFFVDEEETDKVKLLESTKKELERVSQPQAEYTIEAVNLHIDCDYADTVPVLDEEINFSGETRIVKAIVEGDDLVFVFGHVVKGFTDSFQKEIQKSAEATEIKITSIMETRLNQIADVYFGEDGYNYDLKVGNEYNLPAGLYSFDAPIDQDPTKVIYFGAGKLLIADSKATDGGWAWKTALDGQGIVGSSIVAHSITVNELAPDVGQWLDISSNEGIKMTVKSETQSYIDANKDQLKGADGNTPVIQNGYWYINGTSTGIKAEGQDGVKGADGIDGATPYIGDNGNWWINGIDTGVQADVAPIREEFATYKEQTDRNISGIATRTETLEGTTGTLKTDYASMNIKYDNIKWTVDTKGKYRNIIANAHYFSAYSVILSDATFTVSAENGDLYFRTKQTTGTLYAYIPIETTPSQTLYTLWLGNYTSVGVSGLRFALADSNKVRISAETVLMSSNQVKQLTKTDTTVSAKFLRVSVDLDGTSTSSQLRLIKENIALVEGDVPNLAWYMTYQTSGGTLIEMTKNDILAQAGQTYLKLEDVGKITLSGSQITLDGRTTVKGDFKIGSANIAEIAGWTVTSNHMIAGSGSTYIQLSPVYNNRIMIGGQTTDTAKFIAASDGTVFMKNAVFQDGFLQGNNSGFDLQNGKLWVKGETATQRIDVSDFLITFSSESKLRNQISERGMEIWDSFDSTKGMTIWHATANEYTWKHKGSTYLSVSHGTGAYVFFDKNNMLNTKQPVYFKEAVGFAERSTFEQGLTSNYYGFVGASYQMKIHTATESGTGKSITGVGIVSSTGQGMIVNTAGIYYIGSDGARLIV